MCSMANKHWLCLLSNPHYITQPHHVRTGAQVFINMAERQFAKWDEVMYWVEYFNGYCGGAYIKAPQVYTGAEAKQVVYMASRSKG